MSKNTSKSKTVKAVKRVKKAAGLKPLSKEESERLHELLQTASDSNHMLVNVSSDVENARLHLRACEINLAQIRAKNATIHAAIAPLFRRLPA